MKCNIETEEVTRKAEAMVANEVTQQLDKSKQLFVRGVESKEQLEEVLETILGTQPMITPYDKYDGI